MRSHNRNDDSSTSRESLPTPPPRKSLFSHLRNVFERPGLIFLIIILAVISLGIIKPQFYLAGWDNFSSYLNLPNNIFNTIFATWREHRGLGVPSDAEVNDIFRQIFSYVGSFLVGKQLVDQFYFIFMLWGGVLGMYALGREVSRRLKHSINTQELFGFVSAFFYLFNLSTLAVFYFPMIMYITRFFMLPTTIFILLKFLDRQNISKRAYFFYLLILFIGFGSYMVPTIFIVTMIVLGLMFLILSPKKRLIALITFFIALNMYWLLPFANYTIQKGSIVPEAPTFIEINESMLNKPKSYYSFERQAKLRPSFFESLFMNNATNKSQPLHELTPKDEKGLERWILWIFPATYLAGIALTFILKKDKLLLWFAVTTLTFLILSMKEYSILGSVYGFISDYVPFANTVFRFGDTKFHAIVAFGGSIMSAYFLVWLLTSLENIIRSRILIFLVYLIFWGVIISHLFVYKSYFNGNFVGFFMYNKIPSAYFELAEIINRDPETIRVIHLPFDSHTYWKPYTWGYFGSPFLHFMLNKPIFDRAFEPASMENADIHEKIKDILQMTASVPSDDLLDERASDLYELLSSLSVKYIIDDQTISVYNEARNITYWGTIKPADSTRLLAYLEKKGDLKLVKHFEVDSDDYTSDYAHLYPYNKKQSDNEYKPRSINLYEIVNRESRIQFLTDVNKVHSSQTFLTPAIRKSLDHYIQRQEYDSNSLIFPFTQSPNETQIENNQIELSFPIKLSSGNYAFESKSNTDTFRTQLVNVYIQNMDKLVRVYFEQLLFPTIDGTLDQKPKTYETLDLTVERDDYKYLKVGDSVLSIQNSLNREVQFLGSVLIRGTPTSISLLYPQNNYNVSSHLVQLEPNPQCQNDALENASLGITGENGILKISGQNVSGCLTTEVYTSQETINQESRISYVELEFETMGTSRSLDQKKNIDTGKPKLTQYINDLENPLVMDVCIKPNDSTVCANKTSLFRIKEEKKGYVVPIVGDMAAIDKFFITFAVRSSQRQKYETKTTNIILKTYISSKPENITIISPKEYLNEYKIENDNYLRLIIPIAKSNYSQVLNLNNDGFLIRPDPDCEQLTKYKVTKEINEGILNYLVGCRNNLSKNISFSSNNYYFWSVAYKHLSGAIPTLILMDKFNTYTYERLNPPGVNPNNYFSIPWQKPESLLDSTILDKQTISEMISGTQKYIVSGFIEPIIDLQDNSNKEFIIEHFSQNEGLIELNNMSLFELPNYWVNSKISPINYQTAKFDSQVQILSYKRILPSLWQVTTKTEKGGEYLMLFNEQYDDQWIVLNIPTIFHARCDGYANCYKIKLPKGSSSFYLFYKPELLSFVGFAGTTLTAIIGVLYLRRRKLIEQCT